MSAQDRPVVVDRIAEALHQRVAAMPTGERLPTVRELMASFGVSQFTIQRALARLKQDGLIEAQVGRGTFVRGRVPDARRMRDLLVLSYEQQSDRADEMTRSLHRGFLKRDWRSAVLTYADSDQALQIIGGSPRFDACVVQPRGSTIPLALLATLRARSGTVVVEGYSVTGVDADSVAIDWPEAVSMALRHLVDQGHREIAFATQSLAARSFAEACAQFRRLHAWAGLSSAVDPVISLPPESEEAAFAVLGQHLETEARRARPTFSAYVVYPRAFHGDRLIGTFEKAGFALPSDVSVVVLGYTDIAHEHTGRLDTVGQSTQNVIEAIAAAIERRWREPNAPYPVGYLAPELIARGSSTPLIRSAAKKRA